MSWACSFTMFNFSHEVCHNVATEHLYCLLLQRLFSLLSHLPIPLMMLVWILTRGFWSRGQDVHFDVRAFYPNGSSTAPLTLLLLINVTRMQRSENMVIKLETLNMESLLHWSLLQLVAWNTIPLYLQASSWCACHSLGTWVQSNY